LFVQEICVLRISRGHGISDWSNRLHIQQRVVRAGSARCRRGLRFGFEERIVGRGFGRLRRLPVCASRPRCLGLDRGTSN